MLDPDQSVCSDGWRITGYYVPVEQDFDGQTLEVEVENYGTQNLSQDFLDATKMEGWGRTNQGWYIGWTRGHWIKSDFAQNAKGKPLVQGSLAVDKNLIPLGSTVIIPSAPAPWNTVNFSADDTGSAIKGKHLDIFCGEGLESRQETNRVTTSNGRVCYSKDKI